MSNLQPLPDLPTLTVDRSGLTPTWDLSPGMSSIPDGRTIEAMIEQPPGIFYRQSVTGPIPKSSTSINSKVGRYVPLPNYGYLEWQEEV